MKKFLRKVFNFDYRYYILFGLSIAFVLLCVFCFPYALLRLFESARDFGTSIHYYFNYLFLDIEEDISTINNVTSLPLELPFSFPMTSEEFSEGWQLFWALFIDKANVSNFFSDVGDFFYYVCFYALCFLPLFLGGFFLLRSLFYSQNNNYNVDSKPLKVWKKFERNVYVPVKTWIKDFFVFLKNEKIFLGLWAVIFSLGFNFFSIILSFFGYYFYFICSLNFESIVTQLYKLLLDLGAMFNFVPFIVWIILGFIIFDKIRKKIAYKRLNHWEMKNRGFINSLPLVVLGCGTMGSKKTTMITDMGLSQEVMFRDKAFEMILETDLKFPNFPWINLENVIKVLMEKHVIYNLATVRKFIASLRYCFENLNEIQQKAYTRHLRRVYGINMDSILFDYDYKTYGLYYDDKLCLNYLWDILNDYSQLYFIYIIQSSLLISNYSIRTDNILSDVGNFPLWDTDFFKRDSRLLDSFSRHSHILDFDMLRLGRKVIENNPLQDVFEFGIVLMTEIGKERGNSIELVEKKKNATETNQKNDLFDSELKMIRHSATVGNYPFVRIFSDEQRPESWGANARDLCNILHMEQSSDLSLAMPFFDLGEILYSFLFGKFEKTYTNYRYARGDNTLSMYLIKNIMAKYNHYYKGLYNRFGYIDMKILLERGTQDGQVQEVIYKIIVKKDYSKRFSTDCHSGFFNEKALRSRYGINDVEEYATEKATFEELEKQNSYFIQDLLSGIKEFDEI